MKDFGAVQGTFENRSKPKLDIGENPNKYTCPTKIMINKSHFAEFQKFEVGKVNPKIYLITAINLDKTQNDFFKRVTLVMNFGDVKDNVYHPDMRYYFDTYHLCPPGGC
ncbi:hypothetical protein [Chryseobacterium sp. CH1]|nr:hypothetical protein [Chryseobacterium sp. CH1]RXM63824.1 hypothetical protein BOQ60_12875 [Chryseobacterium sp. CH1]